METSESFKVKRNLTALVEFSRVVNESLDLNFILNNVLFTCMGKFLATRGLIALKINGGFQLKSSKGISEELQKKFPKVSLNGDLLEDKSLQSFLAESKLQAVEKINSSDKCLGFICLGEKLNQTPYSEDDREFLKTILNISATAIQNSEVLDELTRVNRKLDSRIQRLSSLFELSKEFGLVNESTKVAKLLVYSVIGQFLVYKFAVVTFEDDEMKILESKISRQDLEKIFKEYNLINLNTPLDKEEIQKKFPELDKQKIELAIPMQIQGKTKGLILLGKRINKMMLNLFLPLQVLQLFHSRTIDFSLKNLKNKKWKKNWKLLVIFKKNFFRRLFLPLVILILLQQIYHQDRLVEITMI